MSDTSEHKPASAQPQDAVGSAAPEEVQPGHDLLLEQAVDDLLQQMDEAEKNIQAAVAEESQQDLADLAALTDAARKPEAEEDNLADVVDALLEQQEAPGAIEAVMPSIGPKETETAAPASEPAAEQVAEALADSVTAQVVDVAAAKPAPPEAAMADDAASQTERAVAPIPATSNAAADASAKPEVSPTLADLDRELTGVANEMLAKENIATPTPTTAVATSVVQASEAAAQAAPTPIEQPVAASHAASTAATRSQQAKAAMQTAIAHATPKAKAAGSWLHVHVEPKVIAMLAVFSKPIASKSEAFKHSIGLVALYTLFVASAFWAYALFLRPTQVKTADAQPFNFQKSGLPGPEMVEQADSHGAGDHGDAAGGHGETKKDDGHGGAKDGKKEAKKPVLNSGEKSVINKTLDDRKKKAGDAKKADAKKSGGH